MTRRIRAEEFWSHFCEAVAEESMPAGDRKRWTKAMYRALHRVGERLGDIWCQCGRDSCPSREQFRGTDAGRSKKGERLNLDFLWFSEASSLSDDEEEWRASLVAIEHENEKVRTKRAVDHWKVCQVATSLRVFVGYASENGDIETCAHEILRREGRWHAVRHGESLVIIGRHADPPAFEGWWTQQGVDDWTKLPTRVPPLDAERRGG